MPLRQISTGLPWAVLKVIKLSTSTLPVPSGEDEIFAWMGRVQFRFRIVVLNTFSLAPYPVPCVEFLTSAGGKSWMALVVWAETIAEVATRQTAARLGKNTELFMWANPSSFKARRPDSKQKNAPRGR